jgi:hypothetical protein
MSLRANKPQTPLDIPFVGELLKLLGVNGTDPSMFVNPVGMAASPGASLLGKMFKDKKVGTTIEEFIDDMIRLHSKPKPDSLPVVKELNPKNPKDALEILMRR